MTKYYKFIIFFIVLISVIFLIIFNYDKGISNRYNNLNNNNQNLTIWTFNMKINKWEPSRTPPKCSTLVFESPINISKVTSILYPGQYRKDGYVSHGGFRYDNPNVNNLKVISPINGYVRDGNRRIVQNGAVQYDFDIINSCGIMMRLDHLTNLSPKFQKLADRLPKPVKGDSRTTILKPYTMVKKGAWVGTQIKTDVNYGLDWGVFDLRKKNNASRNLTYREKHKKYAEQDLYALCGINYLTPKEKLIAKSLPAADEIAGKKSDYC